MRCVLKGVIVSEPREVSDTGKDKDGNDRTFTNVKVRINELPTELGQEITRWDLPAFRWRDSNAERALFRFYDQNEKVLAGAEHYVQFTVAMTKSKSFDNSALLSIVGVPELIPAEGRDIELISMARAAETTTKVDE